jgi:hypothetical protein
MAEFLNIFFFVFHTVWMVFNSIGWIWRKTRRLHLITMLLTAISWFGFGIWYGWGYCVFTDWHWQIRRDLGHIDPQSYTQLLITELTGIQIASTTAGILTAGVFFIALVLTIILNITDQKNGLKPCI